MSYLQKPEQIYVDHQHNPQEIIVPSALKKASIKQQLTAPIGEMIELYKDLPAQVFVYPGVSIQSFGFVFGPPKSGKTTYVESLFLSIAAGRTSFLCNELPFTNKKCLFISLEEAAKQQRIGRNAKQLEAFNEKEKELIKENYIVSKNNMPSFIYNDEQWRTVRKAISDSDAEIVAIDSLNRLTGNSNGEEEVAKRVTKKLQEFVKDLKITLFVINHTTKSSCKEIQTHSSMRGSGLYSSEADFLIAVNRTASNSRYAKLVFSRHDNDDDEMVTEFDFSKNRVVQFKELVSETSLLMDQDRRIDETNERIIYEKMQSIVEAKNVNEVETNELANLVEGDEAKMSRKTFFNGIDKLLERSKIEKLKKGLYAVKQR